MRKKREHVKHKKIKHHKKPLLHKEVKSLILITVFAAVVITLGFFAFKLYRVEVVGMAYKGVEVHLSDFPYPFVEEGKFNTIIVVGDKSPAEDVVSAIDIETYLTEFVTEFDNCPTVYNPDQADIDEDKEGDACDCETDGHCTAREYCIEQGTPDPDCEIQFKCNEDDRGEDYFVAGHVGATWYDPSTDLGWAATADDYCDGDYLHEYFCGKEDMEKDIYKCLDGCADGACICTSDVQCGTGYVCGIAGECLKITCKDSDRGINYFVCGDVIVALTGKKSATSSMVPDVCEDNSITELYCDGYAREAIQDTCPHGCANTCACACINDEECGPGYVCDLAKLECISIKGECTDSDDLDYLNKGFITYDGETEDDHCRDIDTLMEKVCRIDGRGERKAVSCSAEFGDGFVCQDGRCIKVSNSSGNPTTGKYVAITGLAIGDYLDEDGDGIYIRRLQILASEIPTIEELQEQNVIGIGGGNDNIFNIFNYDLPYTPQEEEGVIMLIQNGNDFVGLVVTGYTPADVRRAAALIASDYQFEPYDIAVVTGTMAEPVVNYPVPPSERACFDTDVDEEHPDGKNYFVKGEIYEYGTRVAYDCCVTSTATAACRDTLTDVVYEKFCTDDTIESTWYECPAGCLDGACLPPELPDLADYPYTPFIKDNVFDGVIVVGAKSPAEDVVTAIDIIASLRGIGIDVPAAKLDTEIAEPEAQNLIVVGNPCNNPLVDLFVPCAEWPYERGQAMIKYFFNGNNFALVVAGTTDLDTRMAGRVLANWENWALAGSEVCVSGTGISITPREVTPGACGVPHYPEYLIEENIDGYTYQSSRHYIEYAGGFNIPTYRAYYSDVENRGYYGLVFVAETEEDADGLLMELLGEVDNYTYDKDTGIYEFYMEENAGYVWKHMTYLIATTSDDIPEIPIAIADAYLARYPAELVYECVQMGYKCTSPVRGCGHYAEMNYSCGDILVCCEEIPFCGDGVCFYHPIPGYGETPENCPQDCGECDVIDILAQGEGAIYMIKGKEYDVLATFIGGTPIIAKMIVNGEMTDSLDENDEYILADGAVIKILELYEKVAPEPDQVKFCLIVPAPPVALPYIKLTETYDKELSRVIVKTSPPPGAEIILDKSAENKYEFKFVDTDGNKVEFPFVQVDVNALHLYHLFFEEGDYVKETDDYFIADKAGLTRVFEVTDIDVDTDEFGLYDQATGEVYLISYTEGEDKDVVIGKAVYTFNIVEEAGIGKMYLVDITDEPDNIAKIWTQDGSKVEIVKTLDLLEGLRITPKGAEEIQLKMAAQNEYELEFTNKEGTREKAKLFYITNNTLILGDEYNRLYFTTGETIVKGDYFLAEKDEYTYVFELTDVDDIDGVTVKELGTGIVYADLTEGTHTLGKVAVGFANIDEATASVTLTEITDDEDGEVEIYTALKAVPPEKLGVEITAEPTYRATDTVTPVTYQITITNTGTVKDSYEVIFESVPEEVVAEMTFLVGSLKDVDPNHGAVGFFTLSSSIPGEYSISAKVVSQANPEVTDSVELTLEVKGPFTGEFEFEEDYNLIALSAMPSDPTIRTLFADILDNIEVIYGYDEELPEKWLVFYPDETIPQTLVEFEPGKAYWIDMIEYAEITINGTLGIGEPPTVPTVALTAGWNLIGVHSVVPVKMEQYFNNIEGKYKSIWHYDMATKDLEKVTIAPNTLLYPGEGYWLYMSEKGVIVP